LKFQIGRSPEKLLPMSHLLEATLEEGLLVNNRNWNIQASNQFRDFEVGFVEYYLHRFTVSILTSVIGETWIISLRDIKDVAAVDCKPLAMFVNCDRRATLFASG
jgi:hypothetical protein